MYLKRIKRKCMVRGCKNTDTYTMSKTREMGNSVYMCKDCIAEADKAVKSYVEPEKTMVKKGIKPLFFNSFLKTDTSVTENEPELTEVIGDIEALDNSVAEDKAESFICDKCGKECASKVGLISHQRHCNIIKEV